MKRYIFNENESHLTEKCKFPVIHSNALHEHCLNGISSTDGSKSKIDCRKRKHYMGMYTSNEPYN